MTPRGEDGPEFDWSRHGLLEIVDLPTPNKRHVIEYARKIAPTFAAVHGLEPPLGPDFDRIVRDSLTAWNRSGAFSIRGAVQSVVAALDSCAKTFAPTIRIRRGRPISIESLEATANVRKVLNP